MKERIKKLLETKPDLALRLIFFSGLLLGIFVLVKFSIHGFMNIQAYRIRSETLPAPFQSLRENRQTLSIGDRGTWLESRFEFGQTYESFVKSTAPVSQSSIINLQLIGEFGERQRKVVDATREYLSHFFCRPVISANNISKESLPPEARRTHPYDGHLQFHTEYIIDNLLPGILPKDAMFSVALTEVDLFPSEAWSFVFGQASLVNASAVASLYRFDGRHLNDKDFLRSVIRTVSHEAAHAMNIRHCIANLCLMNGAIDLKEAESTPLSLCPSCAAKLAQATTCSPRKRLKALYNFYVKYGLNWEAEQSLIELSMLPE
jgi:archaemetzincin